MANLENETLEFDGSYLIKSWFLHRMIIRIYFIILNFNQDWLFLSFAFIEIAMAIKIIPNAITPEAIPVTRVSAYKAVLHE